MANWLFKTEPGDYSYADFGLVRFSRLAVIAVPPLLWKRLLEIADRTD